MKIKKRLDSTLAELYPQYSKTQLQAWIIDGKVFVNEKKETKPGAQIKADDTVLMTAEQPKYVCRAGWKLEKALDHFALDVNGAVVLDAGLSTGGFTDCLLQRGAQKIYGVDVGYGQVHEKIRQDQRVIVIERMNLREYEHTGEPLDLVTLDLSFISLLKVMDVVSALLVPGGKFITLIKPQFEAERGEVPRGGVIKESTIHDRIVASVTAAITNYGFVLEGVIASPILGGSGNKEFLAYFIKR